MQDDAQALHAPLLLPFGLTYRTAGAGVGVVVGMSNVGVAIMAGFGAHPTERLRR